MATAINIRNVTKTFGETRALDNVTLSIPKGHIFGFLGPNGAGKTTMIRCLMDYIRTTSGEMKILGKDAHIDSAQLKNSIGYLSSDMQLHQNWTGKTHIEFMGSVVGKQNAEELIQKFNFDSSIKVRNLSSGNKQKLAIILTFLGQPKVLIMDEPTRGLDPLLQKTLYDLLRQFSKAGGTVFFSSHNLAEVQQLCDSVAVIREGKIVVSEAMTNVLHMQVHYVQATFKSKINPSAFKTDSIEIINSEAKTINFKVRGQIDSLVKLLAKHTLIDLEVTHATLEDIFMEYY